MKKHKFLIVYVENFVRGYDCKEKGGVGMYLRYLLLIFERIYISEVAKAT